MALGWARMSLEANHFQRSLPRVIPAYLAIVFALTLLNGFEAVRLHDGWMIGDWLINYQGGFVRRGLLGEGIFQLATLLDINPDKFALTVQALCYAGYFGFSFLLFRLQKNLFPYLFLVFSPFLFMFQIHDFAGGFRKEIIFLAVLAFAVWAAKTQPEKVFKRWFYVLLLLYPALILSHEVIAIWLPLLLVVFLVTVPITRSRGIVLLILLSFSVVAFSLAMLFRGDTQTAAMIAYSLRDAGYMNLSSAIASLARTPAEGMEFTGFYMERGEYLFYYPQTVFLALLAFIPVRKRLAFLLESRAALLVLASLAGSAVVMSTAADWGRFIYVVLVAAFLLSFLPEEKHSEMPPSGRSIVIGAILIIAYSTLWFLPHSEFANPYIWRDNAQ